GQHSETPSNPHWLSNLPPVRDQEHQPFGVDAAATFDTTDSNPNNDGYRELITVPVAGYPDPLSTSRFWNQAGVVIKVDSSNNVTIGQPMADGTIRAFDSSSTGADLALYNMFSGAIATNQTIQDNREGANIRLVTLDVSKILNSTGTAYQSSNF